MRRAGIITIIRALEREKWMEYLRYDVVQQAKEPHIKSTGVRKKQERAGKPHHIWPLAPYKASRQRSAMED